MEIRKPIIIIGTERSGKTLLFSALANHPRLYWLSNLDSLWPAGTIPVTLARRILCLTNRQRYYMTIPGTRTRMQGRFPPSECTAYWKRVFRWGTAEDYLIEDDYFDENDLTSDLRNRIIRDFRLRLLLSGKARLMMEQAGFSLKVLFLDALFPDAIFLHTIRNPFQNHDALVQVKSSSSQRFWGIKVPGWKDFLDADLSTQAAMQLKSTLEILDRSIVMIRDFERRFMRVRYEDLVSIPKETIQRIVAFCDLEMTPEVLAGLAGVRKQAENHHAMGYRKSEATSEVLISLARKYGYLPP